MLQQLQAESPQGRTLDFLLMDVNSPFVIQSIDGLDPVKATLSMSNYSQIDGAQYNQGRRETRNIKIRIGLKTNLGTTLVKDLRRQLYGVFMPKSEVVLTFGMLLEQPVRIVGRVESFESVLFAKDPTVDITIICPKPDFIDPTPVVIQGMSTAVDTAEDEVDYAGTSETGVILRVTPSRPIGDLKVSLRGFNGEPHSMFFTMPIASGDTLSVSTVPGDKYVRLTSSSTTTSALYGLDPISDWLVLEPGMNYVQVYNDGAPVPYELEYTTKYGGL